MSFLDNFKAFPVTAEEIFPQCIINRVISPSNILCYRAICLIFCVNYSWCRGASIGWHSDDNRPYLKQRDFAVRSLLAVVSSVVVICYNSLVLCYQQCIASPCSLPLLFMFLKIVFVDKTNSIFMPAIHDV